MKKMFFGLALISHLFSNNYANDTVVFWGVAPTAPSLHLGSYASIRAAQKYQKMGHPLLLWIEDVTAGFDPSGSPGKAETLSKEIIEQNTNSIATQLKTITGVSQVFIGSEYCTTVPIRPFIEMTLGVNCKKESLEVAIYPYFLSFQILKFLENVSVKQVILVQGEDQRTNFTLVKKLLVKNGIEAQVVFNPLLMIPDTNKKMGKRNDKAVRLGNHSEIAAYVDSIKEKNFPKVWEMLGNGKMPADQKTAREELKKQLFKLPK
jgi:tyrosyl-tRNA synthetase